MNGPICVTGASGLIGAALVRALRQQGRSVIELDLRSRLAGDVRRRVDIRRALRGCAGVVHLAAISRVIWGERSPDLCWQTNVGGVRNVLDEAIASRRRPWVIFASSREVYGEPRTLPVVESAPLNALNVYGHTKVIGEQLTLKAREEGLHTAVVRFSNVYGAASDHADRVIPAFVRGALAGRPLRVDGWNHTFDFTHLDDTVRGVLSVIERMDARGAPPPPIHFVTGRPTSLGELARLVVGLAGSRSRIEGAPPRDFDVAGFVGDPSRAKALLGWCPQITLETGLTRLIGDLQAVDGRYRVNTEPRPDDSALPLTAGG